VFKNVLHADMPNFEMIDTGEAAFPIPYGQHDARCGRLSLTAVEKAVRLVESGEYAAVVTCPINKHSIALAGSAHRGHTEFLGELTNTADFSMMMASDRVRVVLATTHIPLGEVAARLSIEGILKAIKNAHSAAGLCGIAESEIAVCGLNPHAGDEGSVGDEEQRLIIPAITQAKARGINVTGPHPADSLFAHLKENMVVVAMYHDQGLIPVKMDGMGGAVNITLNLPIIRTSVDHGTAFDIAGKGMASESSLKKAIEYAKTIYQQKI
jgi:4-hydroxythreonine-4-phosphate dehydrogenase